MAGDNPNERINQLERELAIANEYVGELHHMLMKTIRELLNIRAEGTAHSQPVGGTDGHK